jgi:hypothetical protein
MNESGNRLSAFQVGSETSSLASELVGTQDQLISGFDPTSNLTLKQVFYLYNGLLFEVLKYF